MLRRKLTGVLMAGLMIAAINVVAASSASAAVFTKTTTACSGGSNVALCYESGTSKFELEGEQSETVKQSGTTTFKINSSPNITITCTAAKGSGTISQKTPLTSGAKTTLSGSLVYEGCSITAPSEIVTKCTIPSSKETLPLSGSLETESELLLKPSSGTAFIEIPFTSKEGQTCPATVKGTRTVTGSQQVTILNPSVAEETKTGEAVLASKLEFFSQKAELTQTLVLSFTGLGAKVYVSKVA